MRQHSRPVIKKLFTLRMCARPRQRIQYILFVTPKNSKNKTKMVAQMKKRNCEVKRSCEKQKEILANTHLS
jgi:hypothetical protein